MEEEGTSLQGGVEEEKAVMNLGGVAFNPMRTTAYAGGLQAAMAPVTQAGTSLAVAADGATDAFLGVLGVRVPTTTPTMSDERRDSILASIRPGDIILETDNAYPGWQRLEFFTMQSHYTHAAIYEGDGKFLEATPPKVARTDLREYLHGHQLVCIVRPDYKSSQDVDAALEYCRQQIGKPYNGTFSMGNGESLYCAELVYNAMKAMPNPLDVPLKKVLGKPAVAPDSFLEIAGATRVYDDESSFWKNQSSHWPVLASAIGTTAVASYLGGPVAGVAGFAGGLVLSILVGNKIQTGHFNFAGYAKK